MKLTVNGETLTLADNSTIESLISGLGLKGKRIAIEVNADIVPRSQYNTHTLHAGDQIEIVHAIGGG